MGETFQVAHTKAAYYFCLVFRGNVDFCARLTTPIGKIFGWWFRTEGQTQLIEDR